MAEHMYVNSIRDRNRSTLVQRVNELYHDLQAKEFDTVHRHRHNAERVFWERVVTPELLRIAGKCGVDLCTGTGFVPRVLLPLLPQDTRIMCVDVSGDALNQTRRGLGNLASRASFHIGDATSVPMADGTADWVTMNAALHHMPRLRGVLEEVHRLLRPGGLFCLGHEPNERFFSTRSLVGIEQLIWHAFWYMSPRQNVRRVRKCFGLSLVEYEQKEHLAEINGILLKEMAISVPLTRNELRSLVDVHAHDDVSYEKARGFDGVKLVEKYFPTYQVVKLVYSDYGGEMLRKVRLVRLGFDRVMSLCAPRKGRLFSFIIEKPKS